MSLLDLIKKDAPFDTIREHIKTVPHSLFEFNFTDFDALFLACNKKDVPLVDYLLSKRSDWSVRTLIENLSDLSDETHRTDIITNQIVYANILKHLLKYQNESSIRLTTEFINFLFRNELYVILQVYYFYTRYPDDGHIFMTKKQKLFVEYWKEQHKKLEMKDGKVKSDMTLSMSSSNLTSAYVDLSTYNLQSSYE